MTGCKRLLWRSLQLYQKHIPAVPNGRLETYSTTKISKWRTSIYRTAPALPHRHHRFFANSAKQQATGQEPPSAQAYISSGILSGKKNLVDVKKVVMIGSGGLSIGQAGEFDYSGQSFRQQKARILYKIYLAHSPISRLSST